MKKQGTLTIRQYVKNKIFGINGLADSQINPNTLADDNFLVNDRYTIARNEIREYNVWYNGSGDGLLNFYTRNNMIDYNAEPFFDRNKTNYFWAVSSTEGNFKRTHSGQPRNIVDTLVNVVGLPHIEVVGDGREKINANLKRILKDNHFERMFLQEQLPLTLVEGWGAWKINWDSSLRDTPILVYYRADSVEFIHRQNQLIAIIFKDYYVDEKGKKYCLLETRRHSSDPETKLPCLIIEKELFELGEDDSLKKVEFKNLPQLKDIQEKVKISNYTGLLASESLIFMDSSDENQGRSIFKGKIDLFDDLDQCLSQSANAVRKSTVKEYMNSNYVERDPDTGMPLAPVAFDRNYVMFNGGKDATGATSGQEAIITSQPALNFEQYNQEAQNILIEIISGIMSPATLGIDVAKKDNAMSIREKEKVTVFTRNTIIREMVASLETIAKELLCANELMHSGEITARDYDVSVKFDEFADSSFESKSETLVTMFEHDVMTPELFVERLYGDSMSETEKKIQVEYIKTRQEAVQAMATGGMAPGAGPAMPPPDALAAMGAAMGGDNPESAAMDMSPIPEQ